MTAGVDNLTYHGGPVMRSNHVHVIYWKPQGAITAPGFETTIDQYLSDVAADSGRASNVYATDTQYSDGSGQLGYNATFVPGTDAVIDTDPLPASGCTDLGLPCLTDTQIQTEIDAVVRAQNWPRGSGNLYLLFTAKNVGSCFDSSSSGCAFASGGYCAYHSAFGSGSGLTVYGYMPYGATDAGGCASGQSPNANRDADLEINLISHEHNESMTDPDTQGGWYDSAGQENGDKCAYDFGTPLGSTASGLFNQVINGNHYYLQREWSNASSACAQSMLAAPTAGLAAGAASVLTGQPVTLDASSSRPASGSSIAAYRWDFGDGTGVASGAPTQSHSYLTPGLKTVTVTVIDADGGASATSTPIAVFSPATVSGAGVEPAGASAGGSAVSSPSPAPDSEVPAAAPGPAASEGASRLGAAACPKRGSARRRCRARQRYRRALARCARQAPNRRAPCRRSAKRAYTAHLSAIRCARRGRVVGRGCRAAKRGSHRH